MKGNGIQLLVTVLRRNPKPFGVVTTCALLLSGCAVTHKRAAIPWQTAVLVRPVAPQSAVANADLDDPLPELKLEIPPPPGPLAATRISPARPRVPQIPLAQNNHEEKTETPQFVPDLSAQESASLQKETEQSLGEAERNLAAASGRKLNATQSDLSSKVRGFVADAHDAGRAGDWARARDLAKKAQVLADELIRSL